MGDLVSQREYDRFVKTTDDAIAQLRADLNELERQRALEREAAATTKDRSWARVIGLLTAAAGVVVAWVGLLSLKH